MTLFEGLSLLVSAVSTLSTVYIGLRQLRRPAPAAPRAPYGAPALPYHLPQPYLSSGPTASSPYPMPASAPRPGLLTAGCLLLYGAATAQPVVFALYYAHSFATDPAGASRELGDDGVIDVLGVGGIALVSALLAVFITRRSRAARALLWTLGAVSTALLVAMDLGLLGLLVDPGAPSLTGLDLFAFGYLLIVLGTYVTSAAMLLPAASRAYFRRT
jgi:hypothetical protein